MEADAIHRHPTDGAHAPNGLRAAGSEHGAESGRGADAASAPARNPALAERYRVLARIGIGGTAIVYRCLDLHTQRIVAVKVLRSSGPVIPEAAARLRREARLAAGLSHPHIVRVFDFGYTIAPPSAARTPWPDDGDLTVPYVAMEYVYGATLKELVKRLGPLPLDWVWTIGEQLCDALAAAHAQGVIHRDIKPQNALVLNSPLELFVKLTDFGIARQVGGDLTTLTVTGQVLGTPDYLSPEQVVGEPGGPLADLYGLGVVLFELITGRLPFEADTPLAAASRRMVTDAPSITAFRRDAPPALAEVISVALRRHASERYSDIQELGQALRWSRMQAGSAQKGERGGWVFDSGVVRPQSHTTNPPPLRAESNPAEDQSTVLRVASSIPLEEPDPSATGTSPTA